MNPKPQIVILLCCCLIWSCEPGQIKFQDKFNLSSTNGHRELSPTNDTFPESTLYDLDLKAFDLTQTPEVMPFRLVKDTILRNSTSLGLIPAKVSTLPINKEALKIVPSPKRIEANGKKIAITPERKAVQRVAPVRALKPQMKKDARKDIQFWAEDEGLPSSLIFHLLKDQKGNLWMGTSDNGVSRFDGTFFTHFSAQESWYGKWIERLDEDQDGNIWISSRADIRCYNGQENIIYPWGKKTAWFLAQKGGHLWLSHRDSGLIYGHQDQYLHFDRSNGLLNERVRGVFIDQQLHSWIYGNEGASHFDGTHFTRYTTKEGLLDNNVKQIMEDRSGSLYFLTDKGISRLNKEGFTNFPSDQYFQNSRLNDLLEDEEGHIWISSSQGLFQLTDSSVAHYIMDSDGSNQYSVRIVSDKAGRITYLSNNGVLQFDGEKFIRISEEDGLEKGLRLNALAVDQQDQVWVSSFSGGINRYKPRGFNHFSKREGLSGNIVWKIEEDHQGNIWLATLDSGISIVTDKGVIQLGKEQGLLDNTIRAIEADSKGNIWIGSPSGLTKFDGQSLTNFTSEQGIEKVESIFEDSKGRLWIGTFSNGIFLIEEGRISHYSKERLGFSYFFEDHTGRVWTTTTVENGLLYFQDGRFFRLPQEQGLSQKEIHTIIEDHRENLWIGTHQGLYYLTESGVHPVKDNEALANSNIISIVEDSLNRLWVATNEGLHLMVPKIEDEAKVDQSGPLEFQFFFYGKADGIRSFDFAFNAAFIDSQNRIWWGRLRRGEGVMMTHLNAFDLEASSPTHLHIADLQINQQFVNYAQLQDSSDSELNVLDKTINFDSTARFYNYPIGLVVPYSLNHLTFYFSALDWRAPHKIQYQYKLEGLDQQWSEPQAEPFADYRNIPPGRHRLHIRASSATQKWGEPIQYSFRVLPPWWQTIWAYVLYGLTAIGLIWLFISWRLRFIRLNYERDTAQTKAQLAAEANEAKSNFLSTISHELRTPLTSIIGFAKINKKNIEEKVLPDIPPENKKMKRSAQRNSTNLDVVIQEGQRLADLINELLDLSKIESGRVDWKIEAAQASELIRHSINATSALFEQKPNVELRTKISLNLPYVAADHKRILQVLINLISNAVKFTNEGHIVIGAEEDRAYNREVIFYVQDSGIGIPAEQLDKVFEKFRQVEAHQAGKPKGTGLGLPICKEILEAHEGRIWVESEEGKGSTFFFTLPEYI